MNLRISVAKAWVADSDAVKSEIEHHKNDQLEKQKDGKGHWKGELATQSEAAVGSAFAFALLGALLLCLVWLSLCKKGNWSEILGILRANC